MLLDLTGQLPVQTFQLIDRVLKLRLPLQRVMWVWRGKKNQFSSSLRSKSKGKGKAHCCYHYYYTDRSVLLAVRRAYNSSLIFSPPVLLTGAGECLTVWASSCSCSSSSPSSSFSSMAFNGKSCNAWIPQITELVPKSKGKKWEENTRYHTMYMLVIVLMKSSRKIVPPEWEEAVCSCRDMPSHTSRSTLSAWRRETQ